MTIDKLEADLRTLADVAYSRAQDLCNHDADRPPTAADAMVFAETLQSIAVGLSTAIRQLQQDVAELRRRIAP